MKPGSVSALLASASTAVVLACGGSDSTGPATPSSHLTIDVRYTSTLTPQQQGLVAAAVDKWTRALSKDLGDFKLNSPANQCFSGEPALNETHHSLLLFVSVAEVDGAGGALAFTQVCGLSGRDTLPMLSHIRLDRADLDSMEARGVLQSVILHEMGHALGFNPRSYLPKGLAGGGTNDPFFDGLAARAEFARHGAWYSGVTVPLENSFGLGPNDPHWRYNVFGDELMVPALSRGSKSPLSSITLGLFQDLGYEVDFSVADPYEVTPLFGGDRLLPEGNLRNDFVAIAPPTFVSPVTTR